MFSEMKDEDFKNLLLAHVDELSDAIEDENTYRAKSEANIITGVLQLWREQY